MLGGILSRGGILGLLTAVRREGCRQSRRTFVRARAPTPHPQTSISYSSGEMLENVERSQ